MSEQASHRILIVDDNPAIHDDFKKILTRKEESLALDRMSAELFGDDDAATDDEPQPLSYEVVSAHQGEQAYEIVRRSVDTGERFALAFVDMRMPPGWDGVETIEKIWSVDPEMQIVICTAYSDHAWEDILRKFGSCDRLLILKKPFDTAEVCQLACALTEKWRLARCAHLKLCQLNAMVGEQTNELRTMNECLEAEIAERRRSEDALKASEARYALAAAAANDGLWDWDLSSKKVFYSARWKLMLGYEPHEIGDAPEDWLSRSHPDDRARLEADVAAHLEGRDESFCGEYRMRTKDGRHRWMLCRGLAVRDASGKAVRIAGSQTDITDRRVAEEQLRHDACHDALTGLANRMTLTNRLAQALARTAEDPTYRCAVLFLDLDKFKVVNDSLGHLIGDRLLIETAERLTRCLRGTDVVGVPLERGCLARIGGDEFVVLLDDLRSESDAVAIAARIQGVLKQPFQILGNEVFTSTSIGIVASSAGYRAAEDILRDADTALYRAKSLGRGTYALFNDEMHAEAMTRWRLENELRRAIAQDELRLVYQPIIDTRTGEIVECEALVRWHHAERGVVSPADFIPLAETSGLIGALGSWVLRAACMQLATWLHELNLPEAFCVSVNVSAKQLTSDAHIVDEIAAVLAETSLAPARLCLEITESAMMSGADGVALLQRLRGLGVKLHLDDFGTGYSSLSYLQRMPVDALKIDQSFVRAMGTDSMSRAIVVAIVTLGHALGMRVIGEGVETANELAALRDMGCDAVQGYHLHRPLDAHKAALVLGGRAAPWPLSA